MVFRKHVILDLFHQAGGRGGGLETVSAGLPA